eukprot:7210605-Lingulodinium_polyedra.AAC.1
MAAMAMRQMIACRAWNHCSCTGSGFLALFAERRFKSAQYRIEVYMTPGCFCDFLVVMTHAMTRSHDRTIKTVMFADTREWPRDYFPGQNMPGIRNQNTDFLTAFQSTSQN